VRFAIAETPEERRQLHRLRCRTAVERGWAQADDFVDGIETDAYDERAVHVGGWDGRDVVAAGRLVFPVAGFRLPVEELFDLELAGRERIVHVDRLCVAREYGDGGHRVFRGLIGRCWLEARRRGFQLCTGIGSQAMLRLYRRLGLTVVPLAPPRRYWNEDRVPILFNPSPTARD
jgi:N-acyl-L-homoserine lactone synthetase